DEAPEAAQDAAGAVEGHGVGAAVWGRDRELTAPQAPRTAASMPARDVRGLQPRAMQPIFAVTVPFFALVLLGYLAAERDVLPESAIPGLNAYVLFFALPCMLFRFGASQPFARLIDAALIGLYLVCA